MNNELSRVVDALPGLEEAEHARWWLWSPGREAHFRAIADGIPALIALMTPTGEVEIVNRHMLEFYGVTLEEMRGRPIPDTLHPDDLDEVIAAWKGSMESGLPYDVEGRHRRADGVYRWFHMRGFPLRDTHGRIVLWYALETDIDDRRRAESLLAGERHLLQMVAAGGPLPDVLDALCALLDANAEGCSSNVLLLDRTRTRVHRAVGSGLPSGYNESLEGRTLSWAEGPCGMAANLRTQVIVSDVRSDLRWEGKSWPDLALAHGLKACWSSPILSRTAELLGTLAIYQREPGSPTSFHQGLIQQFTQIASIAIERTRAEEALRRSEAFLMKAQQLSSTGSFSWRVASDEITWSEEVYRIFGFDPHAPMTLELIATRIHPEALPWFHEMIEQARSGVDFEHDHRLLMPDHTVKHLHVVAHCTRDQDGELEYIGAIQDVTQRRLSEEALDKVRSELAHMARVTSLGALTASIAHEVNQPLSGIITNASTCLRMLAADPANLDGARETARRTIRDGHRAADVIARLRALFSKKTATTESLDLNEAAREVLALSLHELQRSRVVVRAELADELPPIVGDRVQLQQVILNLLLNASEAMSGVHERPRQLLVRTEEDEGDHVRLTVQDVGVGIDAESADQLFDAFYTTKSSGMGIGLSISRSIIESHHGRLWAVANDGPGAAFSFSIPRGPRRATGVSNETMTDAMHIGRDS
jgi:PAS domain S-box-containing protein